MRAEEGSPCSLALWRPAKVYCTACPYGACSTVLLLLLALFLLLISSFDGGSHLPARSIPAAAREGAAAGKVHLSVSCSLFSEIYASFGASEVRVIHGALQRQCCNFLCTGLSNIPPPPSCRCRSQYPRPSPASTLWAWCHGHVACEWRAGDISCSDQHTCAVFKRSGVHAIVAPAVLPKKNARSAFTMFF